MILEKGRLAAGFSIGGGLVYDKLLEVANDEPVSANGRLAEGVATGPDLKWIAFKLRDGARWHDGMPITVDDVVFTLDMFKEHGSVVIRTVLADIDRWFAVISASIARMLLPTVTAADVPMTTIDTLVPVPVRQLWPNEANDFTPWLHDNPGILGDLLGTELFPEDREAAVGRYSADLLFRDNSDRVVVVENMFGPTDHDHLGKLITYSAGLDVGVAVLVAEEFRDEHRSALDWLNHISQDDFAFFGIILEAWRIGDSNPAPRLRVDTQPDGWSRAVRATTSGDSPTAQAYRRFWHLFLPQLHEAKRARPNWSRVSTPSKRHWMSFGSARSELLRYNPLFCREPRRGCRIEAYLDSPLVDPNEVFDWLSERRDDIDGAVNQPVDWDRLDGSRACRISIYFPDEVRVVDDHRWTELVDWMVPTLCTLKDAVDPVIEGYPQTT